MRCAGRQSRPGSRAGRRGGDRLLSLSPLALGYGFARFRSGIGALLSGWSSQRPQDRRIAALGGFSGTQLVVGMIIHARVPKVAKNSGKRIRHVEACIFCGCKPLTQTHIWPAWLNELLRPPGAHAVITDKPIRDALPARILSREAKDWTGSIFNKKPYLCCGKCNSGWMQRFEDEMLKFSKPVFTSETPVAFNSDQMSIFSTWFSLIVILCEYIDLSKGSLTISKDDRRFLQDNLVPPTDTWCIAGCTSNGTRWRHNLRHHALYIGQFTSRAEYDAAVRNGVANNTQLTSCGMGGVFVQAFSCPDTRQVQNFKTFTSNSGLTILWPPSRAVWPLKRGFAQFPTNLAIDDSEADHLADAFKERLEMLTQPPFFGGQIMPP
jgi:hypothetical protein